MDGKIVSQRFVVRGRPTGTKRPRVRGYSYALLCSWDGYSTCSIIIYFFGPQWEQLLKTCVSSSTSRNSQRRQAQIRSGTRTPLCAPWRLSRKHTVCWFFLRRLLVDGDSTVVKVPCTHICPDQYPTLCRDERARRPCVCSSCPGLRRPSSAVPLSKRHQHGQRHGLPCGVGVKRRQVRAHNLYMPFVSPLASANCIPRYWCD